MVTGIKVSVGKLAEHFNKQLFQCVLGDGQAGRPTPSGTYIFITIIYNLYNIISI
jgi:hypothetical protein